MKKIAIVFILLGLLALYPVEQPVLAGWLFIIGGTLEVLSHFVEVKRVA